MKTYIPMLMLISDVLCRYLKRYEAQLKEHTPPQYHPLLDAALAACEALHVLKSLIPVGD